MKTLALIVIGLILGLALDGLWRLQDANPLAGQIVTIILSIAAFASVVSIVRSAN